MDFFFCGEMKDVVHRGKLKFVPDLRRRITAAVAAVLVDVLCRVCGEVEIRFDVCRAVSGAVIKRDGMVAQLGAIF
jgi:hypothetical protein